MEMVQTGSRRWFGILGHWAGNKKARRFCELSRKDSTAVIGGRSASCNRFRWWCGIDADTLSLSLSPSSRFRSLMWGVSHTGSPSSLGCILHVHQVDPQVLRVVLHDVDPPFSLSFPTPLSMYVCLQDSPDTILLFSALYMMLMLMECYLIGRVLCGMFQRRVVGISFQLVANDGCSCAVCYRWRHLHWDLSSTCT